MGDRPKLLIATSNRGKAREFVELLPFDIELVTLEDLGLSSPDETGSTFLENATIKALSAASASGMLTLADDSGICVNALNGAPGLQSARFAGPDASDADNRRRVLDLLRDVPASERGAHFQAVIVVAHDNTVIATGSGRTDGHIAHHERGAHGFGYDPIFLLPDARTMAELSPAEKNEISHRARATRQIVPALERALAELASRDEGMQ